MTLKNQHKLKMNRTIKKIVNHWIYFTESNYLNLNNIYHTFLLERIAKDRWRKPNLKVTSIKSFSKVSMAPQKSLHFNRHFPVKKAESVGVIIKLQKNKKDHEIDNIVASNETALEKDIHKIVDDADILKFANIKLGSIQAFRLNAKFSPTNENLYKQLLILSANRVRVIFKIYKAMEHFKFNENEENHLYRKFLNTWNRLWHFEQEVSLKKMVKGKPTEEEKKMVPKVLSFKSKTYEDVKTEYQDLISVVFRMAGTLQNGNNNHNKAKKFKFFILSVIRNKVETGN